MSKQVVSIPQSEFCPLGPLNSLADKAEKEGFQFLSRNSVRWDLPRDCYHPDQYSQESFNSSVGILSVGTKKNLRALDIQLRVSIPQSEFCPLGPLRRQGITFRVLGFNSSVGILSVGTASHGRGQMSHTYRFQFLSRNSVRWDSTA